MGEKALIDSGSTHTLDSMYPIVFCVLLKLSQSVVYMVMESLRLQLTSFLKCKGNHHIHRCGR